MKKNTLIVFKIHFFNLPLFFMLSPVYNIEIFELKFIPPWLSKRFRVIDLKKYIDWLECFVLRSEAAGLWESISPLLTSHPWQITIEGSRINLSNKANQLLSREFERLFFAKIIAGRIGSRHSEKAYIVGSSRVDFIIRHIDIRELEDVEIFNFPQIILLSVINIFLDKLEAYILNIIAALRYIWKCISEARHSLQVAGGRIKYIYDGISVKELFTDKNFRTFTWVIDEKIVRTNEILFLLPEANFQLYGYPKSLFQRQSFCAIRRDALLGILSLRDRLKCIILLVKILLANFLSFSFLEAVKFESSVKISVWHAVTRFLKPKVYITTISHMQVEDPAILYFNAKGIKTVMFFYGTNSYLFTKEATRCDFRMIGLFDFLSTNLVAWNNHYKDFIESHIQKKAAIQVIGPLMPGGEDVIGYTKQRLCGIASVGYNPKFKYIVFFDCPPKSSQFNIVTQFPVHNLKEYNYSFISDIGRLLELFRDVFFIFKPQRSLAGRIFDYSEDFLKSIDRMKKSNRFTMLDYNINPWIPIALADICISMPFESPNIAALHYGKPAIFHDPWDIAHYHRYGKIKNLISHDFNQLEGLVRGFLYNPTVFKDIQRDMDLSDFVGLEPGTNSSVKFREFLRGLSEEHRYISDTIKSI